MDRHAQHPLHLVKQRSGVGRQFGGVQPHHRATEIRVGVAQCEHRANAVGINVGQKEAFRSGGHSTRQHLVAVGIELLGIEVSVGVDKGEGHIFLLILFSLFLSS